MFIQNTPNFISPNRQCFMGGFESQITKEEANPVAFGDSDYEAQINDWQKEIKQTAEQTATFSVDSFKNPHIQQLITMLKGSWDRYKPGAVTLRDGQTIRPTEYLPADVMAMQLALKLVAQHDPNSAFDPTRDITRAGVRTPKSHIKFIDGAWSIRTTAALKAYQTDKHVDDTFDVGTDAAGEPKRSQLHGFFTEETYNALVIDLQEIQNQTHRHHHKHLSVEDKFDAGKVKLEDGVKPLDVTKEQLGEILGDPVGLSATVPRNQLLIANIKDLYFEDGKSDQYEKDVFTFLDVTEDYDFNGIGKADKASKRAFASNIVTFCKGLSIRPNTQDIFDIIKSGLPDNNVDFGIVDGVVDGNYLDNIKSTITDYHETIIASSFKLSLTAYRKTDGYNSERKGELNNIFKEEVKFLNLVNADLLSTRPPAIDAIITELTVSRYKGIKRLEQRERALILLDEAKENDELRKQIQGLNHFQKLELYGLLISKRDTDTSLISPEEHADYCSVLGVYLSIPGKIKEFETYHNGSEEVSIDPKKVKDNAYSSDEKETITTHLVGRFAYYKGLLIEMGINEDAFNDLKEHGHYFNTGYIVHSEVNFNSNEAELEDLTFQQLYHLLIGMRNMAFSIDHDANAEDALYGHDITSKTREVYLNQINEVSFLHKAFFDLLNRELGGYVLPERLEIDFDANDRKLLDINYWIDPKQGQANVKTLAIKLIALFANSDVRETVKTYGMDIRVTTDPFSDKTFVKRYGKRGESAKSYLTYSLTSDQDIDFDDFADSSAEFNTQVESREQVAKLEKRQLAIVEKMPYGYTFRYPKVSDTEGLLKNAVDGKIKLGTILDTTGNRLLHVWVKEGYTDTMIIKGVKNPNIDEEITWDQLKRKLSNKGATGYVQKELESDPQA